MKITVAGAGYVGLANAVMLARNHAVTIFDIDGARIESLTKGVSPIADAQIQEALSTENLDLSATKDPAEAYTGADYIIIATPTDYDPATNRFNTKSVESVIHTAAQFAPAAVKVLRSTLPIGYTNNLIVNEKDTNIFFMPEFLREGKALLDSLHPSRIIVGVDAYNASVNKAAETFVGYMLDCMKTESQEPPSILYMQHAEAEAVKLFSNTYLAMRVAFFNELDTFAKINEYDASKIICGVSLDPRIGSHYNNPSFGYGGYCLPKDTKQMSANFEAIPSVLINAVVEANSIRKDFITEDILSDHPDCVGIYRLAMKAGTDDFRNSAVQGIIKRLTEKGVLVIIYEPSLETDSFYEHSVTKDLSEFKEEADIIIANRFDAELNDVIGKVYTRDLFNEN